MRYSVSLLWYIHTTEYHAAIRKERITDRCSNMDKCQSLYVLKEASHKTVYYMSPVI